jgi:hypothetical protein
MKSIVGNQANRLYSSLAAAKTDAEAVAAGVIEDEKLLEHVFQGISNSRAHVKFGCSKSLLLLSEKHPELLYPQTERVAELFKDDNRIMKWTAITVIGNLAAVDRENRVRRLLPKLYGFLSFGELITANHAIAALGKIGCAFPEKQRAIASRLIEVETCPFDTDECRNIALGKVILALQSFITATNASSDIFEFVRRQTNNGRAATAKKAQTLMKRLLP